MDAEGFNEETRTEDSGSDVEQFFAILERMEALKKVRREGISGERSKEGEKKIVGGSECGWMPSFEWEDFCDHKSVSVNGDGGVEMQERTTGVEGEVQGSSDGRSLRLRDDVESAANSSRVGKPCSPQLKADISDLRAASPDLNSDDQEEPKLAFTLGLPAFS